MAKKKGAKDMRLLDEISSLQSKIMDIEQQLKDEEMVHEKLLGEATERKRLIAAADDAKSAEFSRHLLHRKETLEKMARIESEKKKRISDMQDVERLIQHDLSNFDLISAENEKLHDTLKELTLEIRKQKAKNASEKEKKTQKNFDFGITMESILRREVKSLYDNYLEHAVKEMDIEATDAWKENKKLLSELQRRIDASLELLSTHQRSYEALKRARIREEVQRQNCKMKENSAVSLTQYTEKQEKLIQKIFKVVEKLRCEYEDSRELFEEKTKLMLELENKTADLRKCKEGHSKLKADVVEQVKEMVETALQFTERDRNNTVRAILGVDNNEYIERVQDASLSSESESSQKQSDHDSAAEEFVEMFDPAKAWNSTYTSRKMNASFSMFKPIA